MIIKRFLCLLFGHKFELIYTEGWQGYPCCVPYKGYKCKKCSAWKVREKRVELNDNQ